MKHVSLVGDVSAAILGYWKVLRRQSINMFPRLAPIAAENGQRVKEALFNRQNYLTAEH